MGFFAWTRQVCAYAALSIGWAALGAAESSPKIAIHGRVIDPAGVAVRGASAAAGDAASTLTDDAGAFSLLLSPGTYTITVAADGFLDEVRTVSSEGQAFPPVEIRLQIRPHNETLTVTETAGYQTAATASATRTLTPLADIPQSISVVSQELMQDQMMMSIGDMVRYIPGITAIQGENNRDQLVIRGNSSSADFFLNGVRDDVQYYRDLYNTERVEALKGPNAMIFGRGGGGGVINRVTKEAGFTPLAEIELQGGAFGHRRAAFDWDRPWTEKAALRFNGVYENSGSFRDYVDLERYGINPTLTFAPAKRTRVKLSYEYFHDRRTADRGIPSFGGRPADLPISTFFGDPADSRVFAGVHLGAAVLEQQIGAVSLRNSTLIGDYDRGYQNYVPGAVSADRQTVALSAYNNATARRNLFNQTDLSWRVSTGGLRHTLLWGAELGRQSTGNFRNTGYFDYSATSITVAYDYPRPPSPAAFRQSPTDADNRVAADVAAGYLQDQVELSRFFQVVAGVRVDRFELDYFNRRAGTGLERADRLVSPRAGVIFKPAPAVSIYGTYSVSWLPGSGDQFSSLTSVTQQVKPEKFSNYEGGVKWDVRRSVSLTAAVYRLDRTNTRATDPNDPTRILQTGSQRTNGVEIGWTGNITGKWQVAGGYGYQDAFISSATAAARAGARVAQVPHNSFSLWNRYQILPRLSAGLGVLNRSDMYAAIDNTVVLPGYTRVDAAAYYSISERIRLQANMENVSNRRYYLNADGNNNISPGYPRTARVGLTARF